MPAHLFRHFVVQNYADVVRSDDTAQLARQNPEQFFGIPMRAYSLRDAEKRLITSRDRRLWSWLVCGAHATPQRVAQTCQSLALRTPPSGPERSSESNPLNPVAGPRRVMLTRCSNSTSGCKYSTASAAGVMPRFGRQASSLGVLSGPSAE